MKLSLVPKLILIIVAIMLVITAGCGEISQGQAEAIAKDFINKNVKFYAKEGESSSDLSSYNMDVSQRYSEEKYHIFLFHIESKLNNETKMNDLFVKVDKKGEFLEFNGQRIAVKSS